MSPAHWRGAVVVAVAIAAALVAAGCDTFAPEVGPLRDTTGESTPGCSGDDGGEDEDDAAAAEGEGGEAGSAPTSDDDDDAGACPPSGANPAS